MSKRPRLLAEDLLARSDSDSSLEAFFEGEYVDTVVSQLRQEDLSIQLQCEEVLAAEAAAAAREEALIAELEREVLNERESHVKAPAGGLRPADALGDVAIPREGR
jgi:hypothetical protein